MCLIIKFMYFVLLQLQLFSRTHNQGNGADITEIGERALQETREYRDQQKRLADIEKELANLSTAVQSEVNCYS